MLVFSVTGGISYTPAVRLTTSAAMAISLELAKDFDNSYLLKYQQDALKVVIHILLLMAQQESDQLMSSSEYNSFCVPYPQKKSIYWRSGRLMFGERVLDVPLPQGVTQLAVNCDIQSFTIRSASDRPLGAMLITPNRYLEGLLSSIANDTQV